MPVTDTAYGTIREAATPVTEARLIADASAKTASTPVDTEAVVRSYFSDIPVMIQVARCESTFRHTLADGTVLRGVVDSADTGVMQINLRYHGETSERMGLDLYQLEDNLAYARHLYETQGTQPWSASAPCWSKTIAMR